MMVTTYARSNGGHLWHILPDEGQRALCGYLPSSPTGTIIRFRGGWKNFRTALPSAYLCEKCCMKHAQKYTLALDPEEEESFGPGNPDDYGDR